MSRALSFLKSVPKALAFMLERRLFVAFICGRKLFKKVKQKTNLLHLADSLAKMRGLFLVCIRHLSVHFIFLMLFYLTNETVDDTLAIHPQVIHTRTQNT